MWFEENFVGNIKVLGKDNNDAYITAREKLSIMYPVKHKEVVLDKEDTSEVDEYKEPTGVFIPMISKEAQEPINYQYKKPKVITL